MGKYSERVLSLGGWGENPIKQQCSIHGCQISFWSLESSLLLSFLCCLGSSPWPSWIMGSVNFFFKGHVEIFTISFMVWWFHDSNCVSTTFDGWILYPPFNPQLLQAEQTELHGSYPIEKLTGSPIRPGSVFITVWLVFTTMQEGMPAVGRGRIL